MIFESMLKDIDPVVSETLNQALESKNISIKQAVELLLTKGTEMIMTTMVADRLRRNKVGDRVTFVINRNINFTNVCIKRCGF
ncbi:7,8-didemethyl-8-hydroxy-5-deazariboflavin synthase subunit CofH, partial [Armatimonadetes bacterium]|nr:7,8-didemethyl-8-hydroxy-5-deazariboflavin synthase subunit CofH [bacterium]